MVVFSNLLNRQKGHNKERDFASVKSLKFITLAKSLKFITLAKTGEELAKIKSFELYLKIKFRAVLESHLKAKSKVTIKVFFLN